MGEPERPQRSFASDPGSPGAPTFERRSTDRRRHDANRRQGEHGPSERRGSDRRKRVARAGLLAAITIAGSFPRLHHPSAQPATPGPQTSDATTQPPERRAADSVLDRIDQIIDEASATYGVNPGFVRAIIHAESRFNPNAVSHVGAQGLMQLMPDTARQLGVSNSFDPRQNIFAGVRYLRILLDMFGGDVSLATAAYNAGATAVQRYNGVPPFKETRGYVAKIQGLLLGLGAPMMANVGMTSYTPGENPFAPKAATAAAVKPARLTPARPRTYFRWKDASGVTHVSQEPPAEGVVYSTIRALD